MKHMLNKPLAAPKQETRAQQWETKKIKLYFFFSAPPPWALQENIAPKKKFITHFQIANPSSKLRQ